GTTDPRAVGGLAVGRGIDAGHAQSHSRPPFRRQKTRPDPTPEDHTQTPTVAQDPDETVPVLLGIFDGCIARWFLSLTSPPPAPPAQGTQLYQLTHRFRW